MPLESSKRKQSRERIESVVKKTLDVVSGASVVNYKIISITRAVSRSSARSGNVVSALKYFKVPATWKFLFASKLKEFRIQSK